MRIFIGLETNWLLKQLAEFSLEDLAEEEKRRKVLNGEPVYVSKVEMRFWEEKKPLSWFKYGR